MGNRTAAIHQPNFIPWAGYFHKVAMSDVFVFFDDVQYPRGKSFVNRVLIKLNDGANWIQVPVIGKSELKPINEVEINNTLPWRPKMLKTIELVYKKSPFFEWLYQDFKDCLNGDFVFLADVNIALISFLSEKAGFKTEFVRSGTIQTNNSDQSQRIPEIVAALKCNVYLTGSGSGSKRYISEENFNMRNISLRFQKFQHPRYNQLHGEFVENLSFIDMLFNCGTQSRDILLSDSISKA